MPPRSSRPKPSDDVRLKRIGKTGILLNVRTGDFFDLDEIALAIWRSLDGTRDVAAIASTLARKFGARPAVVERDVKSFVAVLRRRKLIVDQP